MKKKSLPNNEIIGKTSSADKSKTTFWNNNLIFSTICDFLDIPSLMNLVLVSKEINEMGNFYFRTLLIRNNFLVTNMLEDGTLLEDDPNIKYNLKYRHHFCRDILVNFLSYPNPIEKDSKNPLKVIRNSKFNGKNIIDFNIGHKFSALLTNDKELYIMKTEEMLDPVTKPDFLLRKNVKKFSANSQSFVYLTTSGQVHAILYDEEAKTSEYFEDTIDLTVNNPIDDIEVSYSYIIMIGQAEKAKEVKVTGPLFGFAYHLAELTGESINSDKRVKEIDLSEIHSVRSFCVGNNHSYIVNEKGKVYQIELPPLNLIGAISGKLTIKLNENLQKKEIRKVFSGLLYFFALEREELDSIEKWDTPQLIDWVNLKGFSDYANIIKYENITGAELIRADKKFLKDRLGLFREDLQIKFITEINLSSKPTSKPQILYAWGQNTFGQLGLPINTTSYSPIKVTLPAIDPKDEIVRIECGWKSSCLVTRRRVYLSEGIAKTQKLDNAAENEEYEGKKEDKGGKKEDKGGKKKQKDDKKDKKKVEGKKDKGNKNLKDDKVKPSGNEARWIDITPYFRTVKDRLYSIIKVSISKETLCILGAFEGKTNKQNKSMHEEKEVIRKSSSATNEDGDDGVKKKLTPANIILDRIQWDPNFNKNDFVIAYEDRFLGIIEIPFEEFIQSEAKNHRIQYIKRSGEIVWDRSTRVNLL